MTWEIRQGDALEVLHTMPAESIHCCVTSPPYWGLRDYGTAKWEGGDSSCDHRVLNEKPRIERVQKLSYRGNRRNEFGGPATDAKDEGRAYYRDKCGKCGALRIDLQLGLEKTPEEYIGRMVRIFREVRRVLRSDGTLWLNIGDSYAGSGRGGNTKGTSGLEGSTESQEQSRKARGSIRPAGLHQKQVSAGAIGRAWTPPPGGLKQKDIVGIPWMLAFALRADGWYLRQDIIWAKPNPMPESVRDRCTKSHEYIFLLSKSDRYFYDSEAIAEETVYGETDRRQADESYSAPRAERGYPGSPSKAAGWLKCRTIDGEVRRNKRSVWNVSTKPFAEAHFATFPPDLIEPCIKAGCPQIGCVLDPFSGAGTAGVVAARLGRSFIGIELNPAYVSMAERRIREDQPLFNSQGNPKNAKSPKNANRKAAPTPETPQMQESHETPQTPHEIAPAGLIPAMEAN